MNKKAFSLINILIVIGIIFLAYLVYNDFFKKTDLDSDNIKVSNENPSSSNLINPEIQEEGEEIGEEVVKPEESPAANSAGVNSGIEKKDESVEEKKLENNPPEKNSQPGYYKNTKYNYEISFPEDWPIKIRSEENISIGTVPPKNGQGAITIEIGGDTSNEINELKSEAAKYPGLMSISEEKIILSGTNGTKIILKNNMANRTDVYIIIEKYNVSYIIKYSYESDAFVGQVENSLKSFKFTK